MERERERELYLCRCTHAYTHIRTVRPPLPELVPPEGS